MKTLCNIKNSSTACLLTLTFLCSVYALKEESSLGENELKSRLIRRAKNPCIKWRTGQCMASNGTCGEGVQISKLPARCSEPRRKIIPCNVPCTEKGLAVHTSTESSISTELPKSKTNVPKDKNQRENRRDDKNRKCIRSKNRRRRKQMAGVNDDGNFNCKEKSRKAKRNKQKNKPNSRGLWGKRKGNKKCQYDKGEWSSCNTDSNSQSRRMTLRDGDPTRCVANKTVTRMCMGLTTDCRYTKSSSLPCNKTTSERKIILTLTEDSPSNCEVTKTVTRICGERKQKNKGRRLEKRKDRKGEGGKIKRNRPRRKNNSKVNQHKNKRQPKIVCKYSLSEWSAECHSNGSRTRIKTLIQLNSTIEDPEPSNTTSTCQEQIVISRPCLNKAGIERCFFGNWGEFGDCQNGVKTKHRNVIAGGDRCQRRAVKTKAC